jgi:hypothetical protein
VAVVLSFWHDVIVNKLANKAVVRKEEEIRIWQEARDEWLQNHSEATANLGAARGPSGYKPAVIGYF